MVSIIGSGNSIAVRAALGSVQGVVINSPRNGLAQAALSGPVVVVAGAAIADPVQLLRARAIIESIVPIPEQAPWWGPHSVTLEVCLCIIVEGIGATSSPTGAATGAWDWVILLLRSHM
jgi:hypothetical protein